MSLMKTDIVNNNNNFDPHKYEEKIEIVSWNTFVKEYSFPSE